MCFRITSRPVKSCSDNSAKCFCQSDLRLKYVYKNHSLQHSLQHSLESIVSIVSNRTEPRPQNSEHQKFIQPDTCKLQ